MRHLIRLPAAGDNDTSSNVFGVVEQALEDSESPAANLIRSGLLADLADCAVYEDTQVRPLAFGPWFGPRTGLDPISQAILTNESL